MSVSTHIVEHEILGIASVKKGDGVINLYVNGVQIAQFDANGNLKIKGDFLAGQTF